MKIEDVQNMPRRERRICRANLRLYPSQMKFIEDNQLSVQAIFDKALEELGHTTPDLRDIEDIAREYGAKPERFRKDKRRGRRPRIKNTHGRR